MYIIKVKKNYKNKKKFTHSILTQNPTKNENLIKFSHCGHNDHLNSIG